VKHWPGQGRNAWAYPGSARLVGTILSYGEGLAGVRLPGKKIRARFHLVSLDLFYGGENNRFQSLHQGGYDIDGERQHGDVEEEGDDAVHRRQSADTLIGDLNVRHLRGHGDDQRVVEKVPIIGVFVAGKDQAAGPLAAGPAVELVA